ncbi:hypothetical protein AU186_08005 [Mycobacterium sp. GA-1999]|nr:hypothetical protein AU185_23205 [Mycobacterium sp. GA-0227b]KUH92347.1 hypothetical protein AU186_08005 [Mycobacterium sp. GA-1999]
MAADHVDLAADNLRAGHGSAHERMGAAQAGWIGTSASALASAAAKWEQESSGLHAELAKHGEDLLAAAARYSTTDNQAASNIVSAPSKLYNDLGI